MTESEKNGARLGAQILGLASPVYNTTMPTIDDYECEYEYLQKLEEEWKQQLQNLQFRSVALAKKIESLRMVAAKEELLTQGKLKRSKSCSTCDVAWM